MNRRAFAPIAALLVLVIIVSACQKSEKTPAVATTPIAELIKAGKPPVLMGSMTRSISPVAPTFTISVTNVSDCPVESLKGVVVYFDKDDKFLPGSQTDAGYAELTAIKPGEKIELQTIASDENALTGKWILKEVIYMKPNPVDKKFGDLPYKWTNPNFEAELAAATAGK